MTQPTMYLIVGPNGAGKSTLYQNIIKPIISAPFLNADIVQRDELKNPSMQASYNAAQIIRDRQIEYIASKKSFVTETVFSHESKVNLVKEAKQSGFRVIIYHVGVRVVDISIKRVDLRSRLGGHPVPIQKIRERFERNQPLILQAVKIADSAFIYDNSVFGKTPKLGIKFESGVIIEVGQKIPKWMRQFYKEDLFRYFVTKIIPILHKDTPLF